MIQNIAKALFGSSNDRYVKSLEKIVRQVNALEPQIQARVDLHNGDRAAGIADLLSEKQPSRRMSTPEEIGAVAVFLCSRAAHNITGAAIPVDGGWTAQ